MSREPVSAGDLSDAAEYKRELLSGLGLRADASDQDIESAHNALVEFLELAPHDVKSWASTQMANVDQAFAVLSGPEKDLVPPTAFATTSLATPAPAPAVPAPAPAAPVTPAVAATPSAPPAPAAPSAPTGFAALAANKPLQKKLAWVLAPLLIIAIVVGVKVSGQGDVPGISGKPTGQPTQEASGGASATPVDKAKVAALMKKLSTNPRDVASLQGLGDIYFAATDYKTAATWEQKVLTVDPKNQVALLALGAANFNVGDAAAAKKQWLIAAGLYPKSQEVHYDLGFLYMSATPPDSANMQAEWKKVVAIDPNSNLAKTVATHLKSSTAAPTAAPSAK